MTENHAPRIRVRMNHAHTAKSGWELKETTVEAEFFVDGVEDAGIKRHIKYWAEFLNDYGVAEADRRNREGHSN